MVVVARGRRGRGKGTARPRVEGACCIAFHRRVHRCRHLERKRSARRGQGQTTASEKFSFGSRPMGGPAWPAMKNLPKGKGRRPTDGVPDMSALFLIRHIRDLRSAKARVEGRVEGLEVASGCTGDSIRKEGRSTRSEVPGKVLRRLRPRRLGLGNATRGIEHAGVPRRWIVTTETGELDRPIFFPRGLGAPPPRHPETRTRLD